MSSQDLVNAYMEIQANNPQAAQQNIEMSDAQVNSVMNSAGGESNYNQVVEWAASNLGDRQIDAFDSVVDSGNPAAIGIASKDFNLHTTTLMATKEECYKANQLLVQATFIDLKLNS
ncbi:hypothetical protein [uncultured phage MedDCM-OCT-S05-C429]|nr:hypothetical protein [uncultured phage MedDCM-OCT-S05-C429]